MSDEPTSDFPVSEVTFNDHVLLRFAQRFPTLDIRHEWRTAQRSKGLPRNTWNYIRDTCAKNGEIYMPQWRLFKGVYYKISKNQVVFVVRPPLQVITVLKTPIARLVAKPPDDEWPQVPGEQTKAVRRGKVRSEQFETILKTGNLMHALLTLTHPDLAAQWVAAIKPPSDEAKEDEAKPHAA